MILKGAGENLGGGCRGAVDQNDDRVLVAAASVPGVVGLLGRRAPVVRNDELAALQEVIGNLNAGLQKSARVVPKIEDQALNPAFTQPAQRP
jgi:hypothetical protein